MLRLVNSDLPEKASSKSVGSIARIYDGDRNNLAPIAQINVLANYTQEGGITSTLSAPLFVGSYFRIELGYESASIKISDFIIQADPLTATPNQGWVDGTRLNLLVDNIAEYLVIDAIARVKVPIPVNSTYVLTVPSGFTATGIDFEGLHIEAAALTQVGSKVTVATDARLRVGAELQLTGTHTVSVPEPKCAIAVFHLPLIAYLDAIDFMGQAFTPSNRALSPQIREFTWNDFNSLATIFMTNATGLQSAIFTPVPYSSSISTIRNS